MCVLTTILTLHQLQYSKLKSKRDLLCVTKINGQFSHCCMAKQKRTRMKKKRAQPHQTEPYISEAFV